MVAHVAYCQEVYRSAAECLAAIQRRLADGWWLSALEVPAHQRYVVTFGISDESGGSLEPAT